MVHFLFQEANSHSEPSSDSFPILKVWIAGFLTFDLQLGKDENGIYAGLFIFLNKNIDTVAKTVWHYFDAGAALLFTWPV